jgi:TldD protein
MRHPQRSLPGIFAILVLALTIVSPTIAQADDITFTDIMSDELDRELAALSQEDIPPYFIAYTVTDVHMTSLAASFGALTSEGSQDSRLLTAEVRVGDYALDNTHELRDQVSFSGSGFSRIPVEDDPAAIRAALWRETNRQYRTAVERYAKVVTNVAIKVAAEDSSADFSRESPVIAIEPPVDPDALVGDLEYWRTLLADCSAPFLANPDIYGGRASFSVRVERKYLVNSEGVRIARNQTYASLGISGFIKSDDGMELPLYRTYFAFAPDGLPEREELLADVAEMLETLAALRDAPAADPFSGPAILSGRASAVFFHEILGHRVEGHRQKSEYEGQTFRKHVGERILPPFIDLVFDPTTRRAEGSELMGWFTYDDEGVPARPVTIVDDGVLTGFLMSRGPIEGFDASNGHGRAQAGRTPVSRQSNMLVTSDDGMSDAEMRVRLADLCREQDAPYGLYIKDLVGGYTLTGRSMPNVFNLQPVEVYRVYPDGRPDELVRGVDLVGTPLVMFSMIEGAGTERQVFNGLCGAESGSVPVAAISPSLLLSRVEVQKRTKSQERPPVLPRPDSDSNAGQGR